MKPVPEKQETPCVLKKNSLGRYGALVLSLCFVPGSLIVLLCVLAQKQGSTEKLPLFFSIALLAMFMLLASISWAW
ncbi:MAG: hypothetical protein RRA35_10590 [Desulfomonilia bacterium]|nr:hypothetical protein [Desulfomonilia bacterium]